MTLSFEEAVFGKETDIEIPREETCDTCHGSWSKTWNKTRYMFTLSWNRSIKC